MTRIIGIDCATQEANVALALARLDDSGLEIQDATRCSRKRSAVSLVASWLSNGTETTLLALDAPLGWPATLGEELKRHRAGERIEGEANSLFRRATDTFIQRELGQTPLDVGADHIARTALSALRMLSDLRARLDAPIPLAWTPALGPGVSAIEVYPAATLVAHGIRSKGYKKPAHSEERHEILDSLRNGKHVHIRDPVPDLSRNGHLIDAAVCVLAGCDFLQGRAMSPEDRALAEREGWIWSSPRQKGGK
jgi:predicted RNase H-like nuclease